MHKAFLKDQEEHIKQMGFCFVQTKQNKLLLFFFLYTVFPNKYAVYGRETAKW